MSGPCLTGFVIDAADPAGAAAFWAAALGGRSTQLDDGTVSVREVQPELVFRPQDTAKSVKNRVHFDVHVSTVEPLLDCGATVLATYPDESRVTMADGEGNEFCAFIDSRRPAEPWARVFAVCTDSVMPEQIAAWWAARTGARIGPGSDGTPRWLYDAPGWGPLVWKFVRVGDARLVPNRWQWQMTGTQPLLTADARRIAPASMIDPDGNHFGAR